PYIARWINPDSRQPRQCIARIAARGRDRISRTDAERTGFRSRSAKLSDALAGVEIGYEHMVVPIYRESPWRIKPAAEELVRLAVGIDPGDRCSQRVCHPHVAAAVDRQTQRPFEHARRLRSRKPKGGKQGAIRCELDHRV